MHGKVVKKTIILTTTILLSASMVHEIDNPHVDQRQHEEESKMTYENPYNTASVTTFNPSLLGFDSYSRPHYQLFIKLKK